MSDSPPNLSKWLPVVALAFATFLFLTSETLPVGLLPEISAGLNITEAETGFLMTGYAWVVALISLPLTLVTAWIDRRILMAVLFFVFAAGNFLAGHTDAYGTMLGSRLIVACSHAIFWSIVAPLAARLAPEGKQTKGIMFIGAGTSAGGILGVPLATFIGQQMGWRAAFVSVSGTAIVIIIILLMFLPPLPSQSSGSLRTIPQLIRNKPLMAAYATMIFFVTGLFTVYTYLVPMLTGVVHVPSTYITASLMIYGIAGAAGIYIGGKFMDRSMRYTILTGCATVLAMIAVIGFTSSFWQSSAVLVVWGVGISCMFLGMQVWIMRLAPRMADAAMSVYSSIFNVGIGSGALFGGYILNNFGLSHINLFGVIVMIPAVILIFIYCRPKVIQY